LPLGIDYCSFFLSRVAESGGFVEAGTEADYDEVTRLTLLMRMLSITAP